MKLKRKFKNPLYIIPDKVENYFARRLKKIDEELPEGLAEDVRENAEGGFTSYSGGRPYNIHMGIRKKHFKNHPTSGNAYERIVPGDNNGCYTRYKDGDERIMWNGRDLTTLAHELGHRSNAHKNKIVKEITNNLHQLSRTPKFRTGEFLNGVHTGLVRAQNKSEGKKTKFITKAKPYLLAGVAASPNLIEEIRASRKGYGYLKSAGANKDELNYAKKSYKNALGTYAGAALIHPILAGTGDLVGTGVGRYLYRNRKRKEDKKEED